MKLFRQIEQLELIHKLVKEKSTGCPKDFAQRLNISQRRLFSILDEMKCMGAPIIYSRTLRTYYYKQDFDIKVTCTFRLLSDSEQQTLTAGHCDNSTPAFFVQ